MGARTDLAAREQDRANRLSLRTNNPLKLKYIRRRREGGPARKRMGHYNANRTAQHHGWPVTLYRDRFQIDDI